MRGAPHIHALVWMMDSENQVVLSFSSNENMPMTKCSVVVKFISTVHPDFRNRLLKANVDEITDDESIFHNSPHNYYQS